MYKNECIQIKLSTSYRQQVWHTIDHTVLTEHVKCWTLNETLQHYLEHSQLTIKPVLLTELWSKLNGLPTTKDW